MKTWLSDPAEEAAAIKRQRQMREAEAKLRTCPFCYKDAAEITLRAETRILSFCSACKQTWITMKSGKVIS